MKAIKNIKWSVLLVPLISAFFFVTIITAAPKTITAKMDDQEIQTIAAATTETTNDLTAPQPAVDPQAVPIPANTSTPSTTPAPANTPAKKAQSSRSTDSSSTPSKPTTAKPTSQPTNASAIIATGKQYIGVKYVFGGTTPAGFDCSGFVQYVFAKNGINLPRVSRDQFKIGTAVSFSNLQPGDLVFFSLAKNGVIDHDGIYVGNGQFINASSSKGVTIYTMGTYWKSAYVGAKRVL
ncbi:C40 family peptidase [Desulfosporosinus shakirovi]|uniref:C40 family peptidase n=1 Tax=Desulfosporosinus shakirovi TaxID=2885154 RepID=UPI001E3F03CA|nr:C40 family peptidase [Desulfosporosinus sp. SRJS8]MCB8815051.1 NlpC/P60 family protein [Desulfosporosinus sp. SRJS8]